MLGAKLYGLALEPPTKPSLFEEANLDQVIKYHIINIKCSEKVSNLVNDIQPDFLFHLAAQPLLNILIQTNRNMAN